MSASNSSSSTNKPDAESTSSSESKPAAATATGAGSSGKAPPPLPTSLPKTKQPINNQDPTHSETTTKSTTAKDESVSSTSTTTNPPVPTATAAAPSPQPQPQPTSTTTASTKTKSNKIDTVKEKAKPVATSTNPVVVDNEKPHTKSDKPDKMKFEFNFFKSKSNESSQPAAAATGNATTTSNNNNNNSNTSNNTGNKDSNNGSSSSSSSFSSSSYKPKYRSKSRSGADEQTLNNTTNTNNQINKSLSKSSTSIAAELANLLKFNNHNNHNNNNNNSQTNNLTSNRSSLNQTNRNYRHVKSTFNLSTKSSAGFLNHYFTNMINRTSSTNTSTSTSSSSTSSSSNSSSSYSKDEIKTDKSSRASKDDEKHETTTTNETKSSSSSTTPQLDQTVINNSNSPINSNSNNINIDLATARIVEANKLESIKKSGKPLKPPQKDSKGKLVIDLISSPIDIKANTARGISLIKDSTPVEVLNEKRKLKLFSSSASSSSHSSSTAKPKETTTASTESIGENLESSNSGVSEEHKDEPHEADTSSKSFSASLKSNTLIKGLLRTNKTESKQQPKLALAFTNTSSNENSTDGQQESPEVKIIQIKDQIDSKLSEESPSPSVAAAAAALPPPETQAEPTEKPAVQSSNANRASLLISAATSPTKPPNKLDLAERKSDSNRQEEEDEKEDTVKTPTNPEAKVVIRQHGPATSAHHSSGYSYRSTIMSSNTLQPAYKSMEALLGSELASKLTFDYTNKIPDPKKVTISTTNSNSRIDTNSILSVTTTSSSSSSSTTSNTTQSTTKLNSNRNSVDSNSTNEDISGSSSDTSILSKSSSTSTIQSPSSSSQQQQQQPAPTTKPAKSPQELDLSRRQKADEYYHIEEKQANLLKTLATSVYKKFLDENERQQHALCDPESMTKIFYILAELAPFAELVHGEVATTIKSRLENEWTEKPYFGDILSKKCYYYRTYKAILQRFPTCQVTLSNMLKKKPFASQIKKLLETEATVLDNVNRIDMLLDRLVDFPRRVLQLLGSYLKLLDNTSTEFTDITLVFNLFTDIFESSNEALNKMSNFQSCYNLQYTLESNSLNIVDSNRLLIKQGPIYKVAKRNGELLLRHLALFTDILLVSKVDRMRRTLRLNYQIGVSDIKLIENSSDSNELMFRIISSDQNNEFLAERPKDKEDWLKAFRKVKDLEIIESMDKRYSDRVAKIFQIGVDPPVWIPDGAQNECSGCKESFNAFKRRHHCRTCGKLYCKDCCNFYVPCKFTEFKKKVRVCKSCFYYLDPIHKEFINGNNESANSNNGGAVSGSVGSGAVTDNGTDSTNDKENIEQSKLTALEALQKSFTFASLNNKLKKPTDTSADKKLATLSEQVSKMDAVVKRRRPEAGTNKSDNEDDHSSSSLTEEQLKLLSTYFVNNDAESNENDSESSDEDEIHGIQEASLTDDQTTSTLENSDDSTLKSKPESLVEKLKPAPAKRPPNLKTITDPALIDAHNSKSSSNRSTEQPAMRGSVSNDANNNINDTNNNHEANHHHHHPHSVLGQNRKTSHPNITKTVLNKFHREPIHHEYGYLCKISINDNEVKELNEDKTLTPNTNNNNNNNSKKWDRQYLVLYSDSTIGVCSNQHDITNPSLVIQLPMFTLKPVDDTSFGLYKIDLPEKHSIDLTSTNEKSHKDSSSESATTTTDDQSANIKPISLKKKLKLFETNFELKFTNKDSKNKWFELISNELNGFD